MRKNIFGFLLALLSFAISTGYVLAMGPIYTTTNIPGCTSANGFSIVTGQSCAGFTAIVQTPISGCTSNVGFSITTGQSCANNPVVGLSVTSVAASYDFGTITLVNGSWGEAVKQLQLFLNANVGVSLAVDGKLGPKTIAVIKKWQKDHGLVADGLIGAKTKAMMNASVSVQ
jgi:hypothetical protein